MRSDDSTKIRGPRAQQQRLLVFWEGGSAAHELRPPVRVVVGRADECDVRVAHESVSRRHAVLAGDGTWTVEDLGSANGTFVDGRKIARGDRTRVEPGTVVMLGDARLVLDAEPADASASVVDPQPVETPMDRVHRLVDLVADSPLPVLLLGETGVGKGMLAETIHRRSSRRDKPLARINCAAVPEALLESELFGHERGAFTGAVQAKTGLLEAASAGTAFLDEIGDVPRSTQAKLLHVLEHGEVLRVGAVKPRPIDVRFVAATNHGLETAVADGTFRRDLYFRLAGVPVRIPPLRERTGEIATMASAFIAEACERANRPVPSVSDGAMARMHAHPWPGNIRELRNVVMRAALLCGAGPIRPEHLMLDEVVEGAAPPVVASPIATTIAPPPPTAPAPAPAPADGRLEPAIRDFERRRIADALDRFGGHQGRAAEYLGISRRTLTKKLTDLDMPRPRKRRGDDSEDE